MNRMLLLLTLLLLPLRVAAQDVRIITSNLDVTSTSYVYYVYTEPKAPITGAVIDAVAASTSITSGATGAFTGMAVGDLLYFNRLGVITTRRIVTFTDANTIVVNASTTLAAGTVFTWRQRTGGTATTDGWFSGAAWRAATLFVNLTTLNSTSIEVQVECRGPGTPAADVLSLSYTAATTSPAARQYPLTEVGQGCVDWRVGTKETADSGAQDLTVVVVGVR